MLPIRICNALFDVGFVLSWWMHIPLSQTNPVVKCRCKLMFALAIANTLNPKSRSCAQYCRLLLPEHPSQENQSKRNPVAEILVKARGNWCPGTSRQQNCVVDKYEESVFFQFWASAGYQITRVNICFHYWTKYNVDVQTVLWIFIWLYICICIPMFNLQIIREQWQQQALVLGLRWNLKPPSLLCLLRLYCHTDLIVLLVCGIIIGFN